MLTCLASRRRPNTHLALRKSPKHVLDKPSLLGSCADSVAGDVAFLFAPIDSRLGPLRLGLVVPRRSGHRCTLPRRTCEDFAVRFLQRLRHWARVRALHQECLV